MRVGLHLPQFRSPVSGEDIVRVALAAEAAGIDDLWVSDHVALPAGSTRPPSRFHDALTVLTWAAAVTRRCRLGTSVLVAPYRHPVLLAKSLASLDVLSGGRVIMGIASGWLTDEFAVLDAAYPGRGRTTDRAIDLCRALWAGEPYRGAVIEPRPPSGAALPVWVGGNSDVAIRRAVRRGDGWHTTVADPERLAERLAVMDDTLLRRGRRRAELVVSVRIRTDAAGFAEYADRWRELGVDHVLIDHTEIIPEDLDAELRRLREIAGPPVPLPVPGDRQ